MNDYKVKSPVVMMVFNRPKNTRKVLKEIRKVRPDKLFVIADGPRMGNKDDLIKCSETRKIFENVDWDCKVYKRFLEKNLGCAKNGYMGFNWIFENVEEAIFLEDDCVPDISFFRFCDELLEKYRYDSRVMLISGTNQLGSWKKTGNSYHFSKFGGIWGWASWRRAWKFYDFDIKLWNDKEVRRNLRKQLNFFQYISRKNIYDQIYNKRAKFSSWAYQWGFARIVQSGLAISPCVNLVSNIGSGDDATNNKMKSSVSNLKLNEMIFPLKHPLYVLPDEEYDKKNYNKIEGSNYRILKNYVSGRVKKWWLN